MARNWEQTNSPAMKANGLAYGRHLCRYSRLMVLVAVLTVGSTACGSKVDVIPVPAAVKSELPFTWRQVSQKYEELVDYTALYEKEEASISKGEKQSMRMSFRKPFDVRLDWLDDRGRVDQSAVYQAGRNGGAVLVHKAGLLGKLVGTISVMPGSKAARADSEHPITEIGIGTLIERLSAESDNPQTSIRSLGGTVSIEGREAYKVEMSNPSGMNLTGFANAFRAIVIVDKGLYLPVEIEIYGSDDQLLERHVFRDIKQNQKLTDKNFEI